MRRSLLVVPLLVLALAGCASAGDPDQQRALEVPEASALEPAVNPVVDPWAGLPTLIDADWAGRTAEATGIPRRAMLAYGGAAVYVANQNPSCNLGWNTLAGIGEMESHHGTIFDGAIEDDGLVTPPIYGIALDGADTHTIPDSDKGAIDGDPEWDRAVGPLQFIPDSWQNWGTDGSGDGAVDPHNFDDAVLATANYLCHAGGDLSLDDNWRAAIAAYNDAAPYAEGVAEYAIRYSNEASTS
ncbi:lytic murein transglycosylase [Agreia sp. COWG]|uniref:lytic murein transglycosylase n=1 Tax=Agreia sp. COWG TaxID=2773266 RepID=UPI0019262D98|nr:lytic murein transglycosylase [Agreia sp. COWG]